MTAAFFHSSILEARKTVVEEFPEGTEVVLKIAPKSASPMVVEGPALAEGKLTCLYYEGNVLRRDTFAPKTLKKYVAEKP